MPEDPFVEIHYGPVRLTPPVAAPPKRAPLVTRIGEALGFLRTLIVNLAVIAAVVALVVLTVAELRRQPVIIEEISLPPALTARGYSGAVAAQRLWDAITRVQQDSGTLKEQAALTTVGRQIDIVEPGTGLSLQGLTQMLRALLGLPQIRIAGDVTCETAVCDWSDLRLRLRIFTETGMELRDVGLLGARGTADYFHRAALEAMAVIDPYSLATYRYHLPGGRSEAERIARDLIATSHPQRAWAATLLGIIAQDQGRHEEAIRNYERATLYAKTDGVRHFVNPWNGWGKSLGALGRNDEAVEKYRRATEIDPEYAYAWYGWGYSLTKLGRYDEAIPAFERASALDPGYGAPVNAWAYVLSKLGRHADALPKFEEALAIDPGNRLTAQNWAESLVHHLDADPAARCERAKEFAPAFRTKAAPLLTRGPELDRITAAIGECGISLADAAPE
ncbi:MAG: tetratricopeptide repeat protein [Rhodobacteraceae bacterium]|nr:tetratricopeptide repeat protein [Paracoccaceae bacterium]